MPHYQIKNHIKQFLKGNLSKEDEIKLLSWIKGSPVNKKHFLEIQHSLRQEMLSRPDSNTEKSWQLLLKKIEPELIQKTIKPVFRKYLQLAASLAAAALIGFFAATFLNTGKTGYEEQIPVLQKISTPFGARTQFILPDSSVVWLNSGSEIEFPSHFGDVRNVVLSGEAFFEVTKNDAPFVVSSVFGDVEVKGTSFNVRAYQDDHFETTLVEGKVEVTAENGEKVMLIPGFQAVYKNNQLTDTKVDTELFTSWTNGKLIFNKEYLPRMAKRLEQWYNVKIVLDNDKRLESLFYTATIEMESFSEVLNLLKVTAPVNYSWDDKTRIIRLYYEK